MKRILHSAMVWVSFWFVSAFAFTFLMTHRIVGGGEGRVVVLPGGRHGNLLIANRECVRGAIDLFLKRIS